jgi:hypothetical protein
VTGAHIAIRPVVTAVSSDPGTPSSPPINKDLTQVHMVVTQNQNFKEASTTFRTDKINPNPKDLAEIRRTLCVFQLLCDLSRLIQELGK